jgi:hypothetical protein
MHLEGLNLKVKLIYGTILLIKSIPNLIYSMLERGLLVAVLSAITPQLKKA